MAQQYEMLSFGVLMVIIALTLIVFWVGIITGFDEVVALIIILYGLWEVALGGIRTSNPQKYGRGAYSTLMTGILLIAVGGAWFLFIATADIILTVVVLLLVIGILAVITALPSMRQKPSV